MSEALAQNPAPMDPALMERVLLTGDLAKLTPQDRLQYYEAVCKSVGLNPLTRPFEYITLNGKLVLYAKRDCTEQLRKIHGVSIVKLEKDFQDTLYVVTAYAKDKHGREDVSTGAVDLGHLKGEMRANSLMKCETKAKRRVTLSICGLGFLDETEVDSIPGAVHGEPRAYGPPKKMTPEESWERAPYKERELQAARAGASLDRLPADASHDAVRAHNESLGYVDTTTGEIVAPEPAPELLDTRTPRERGAQPAADIDDEAIFAPLSPEEARKLTISQLNGKLRSQGNKMGLTDAAKKIYWKIYIGEGVRPMQAPPEKLMEFVQFLVDAEQKGLDLNAETA